MQAPCYIPHQQTRKENKRITPGKGLVENITMVDGLDIITPCWLQVATNGIRSGGLLIYGSLKII